jgi:hypothetical protein
MVYLQTKSNMRISKGSLVIIIKQKAEEKLRRTAMLSFNTT